MIPKIIHYCWFGGNPLPKDAKKCIASWKRYLPGYKIKEWNENNFDINCCSYVKEAYEAKKYAFVSDYVRFFVLYNEGGLYFDTDVEIIRNMDHIINAGNFMGFEKGLQNAPLGVAPGLGIGAEANEPLFKTILKYYENKNHFTFGDHTVVTFTTNLLKEFGYVNEHKFQKVANFNIYPAEYFCPMDSTTGKITITDKTVSIHHYSCSWIDHNTLSWKLHILKNKLIELFGEKFILGISKLFKR